jgi:hypothetical protein
MATFQNTAGGMPVLILKEGTKESKVRNEFHSHAAFNFIL